MNDDEHETMVEAGVDPEVLTVPDLDFPAPKASHARGCINPSCRILTFTAGPVLCLSTCPNCTHVGVPIEPDGS